MSQSTLIADRQEYGAALLRLCFGSLLLSHGLMKLLIWTIPGTVAFFGQVGFPPIDAYLTMFGEIAGGIALIVGLFTRLAALLTLPLLLGALWVHHDNGLIFSNPHGGWEFPAFLVVIAIVVALQGGGAASLDRLPIAQSLLPRFARA